MFEYHGWIKIRASAAYPEDGAFDEELSNEAEAEIRSLVEDLSGYALMRQDYFNVAQYIHMAGHPNHRGAHGRLIIDLFTQVGQIAPGSYGLLYVYDDEDQDGWNNEYQVFRMVRGQVTRERDPFLSPVVGYLEDVDPLVDSDDEADVGVAPAREEGR